LIDPLPDLATVLVGLTVVSDRVVLVVPALSAMNLTCLGLTGG
jgi:hypothetical protein